MAAARRQGHEGAAGQGQTWAELNQQGVSWAAFAFDGGNGSNWQGPWQLVLNYSGSYAPNVDGQAIHDALQGGAASCQQLPPGDV
jgi:hypothetical protein